MTPEGRVKEMVKRRMAAEFGNQAYRFMPVQNGMGAPSLDFLYCFFGRFVAVETKAPGKKMTPRQEITASEIRQAGGVVYTISSQDDLDLMILDLHRRRKYVEPR